MTDRDKAVDEFVKLTCASETEARNYLETAGWSTERALTSYFDDRDDRVDPASLDAGAGRDDDDSMNEEDFVEIEKEPDESPSRKKTNDSSKPYTRTSNIATLSSMRRARENDEDEEEDDDQLYYAGGSEHSGQQIMGNDRRADMAGEVFKHLKQMVSVGGVELAGPSNAKKTTFGGVGYRLGQTPEDTQVIGNASGTTSTEDSRSELHLRLFRDGFTVGDEPLRPYTDRENRRIMEYILRGEVPLELVPPGITGNKVNVKVEDMRHTTFSGSSTSSGRGRNVFSGPGHVLGNVVPNVVKTEETKPPEEKPVEVTPEPVPESPVKIDDKSPTTNIAVRLPNGTRSQVRLNFTHTVEDLRSHLTAVHRELTGENFVFMVNFPPKEVTDEKLSVSDAGLVNSSVLLRIKKD